MASFLADFNPLKKRYLKEYAAQTFDNPIRRFLFQTLYSNFLNLGLRRVTQQSILSTAYFLNNINNLPATGYISIRYEDLCQDPELTILKILESLQLEAKTTLNYQKLVAPRPLNLLPEVQKSYDKICSKLQPYLTHFGYTT